MKLILTIIICITALTATAQVGQIEGKLIKHDSTIQFPILSIALQKEDSLIKAALVRNDGSFSLKNITNGVYKLAVKQLGFRDVTTDSVIVSDGKITNVSIPYPQPCPFVYAKGRKPKCPGGHTDKIIPIVYGLPSVKTMKRSKEGLIYLGGCIISGCDPHYYCTIHKREL